MTLSKAAEILKIGITSVLRFVTNGMLKRSMKFIDGNGHVCHEISQDDIDSFLSVYEKVGTRYKVKKDIQSCLLNGAYNKNEENIERNIEMKQIEVAKLIGVHPVSVTRLITEGKLKASGPHNPGYKHNVVTQQDVDEFLLNYERIHGRYIRKSLPNGFRELPVSNITKNGPKQNDITVSDSTEIKSGIDMHEVLTWVVEHAPLNIQVAKCLEIRDAIVKLFDEL